MLSLTISPMCCIYVLYICVGMMTNDVNSLCLLVCLFVCVCVGAQLRDYLARKINTWCRAHGTKTHWSSSIGWRGVSDTAAAPSGFTYFCSFWSR